MLSISILIPIINDINAAPSKATTPFPSKAKLSMHRNPRNIKLDNFDLISSRREEKIPRYFSLSYYFTVETFRNSKGRKNASAKTSNSGWKLEMFVDTCGEIACVSPSWISLEDSLIELIRSTSLLFSNCPSSSEK